MVTCYNNMVHVIACYNIDSSCMWPHAGLYERGVEKSLASTCVFECMVSECNTKTDLVVGLL